MICHPADEYVFRLSWMQIINQDDAFKLFYIKVFTEIINKGLIAMIYLFCIYLMNRMRKKKPRDIKAVNNKIRRLSQRGRRLWVKQEAISAERKPPSSGLQ